MELHRSEMVMGSGGVLIPVTFYGLAPHDGSMRNDILNLKFHDKRQVAQQLAEQVAMRLLHLELMNDMHFITWAPTTSARKITRGYDQAELLARHIGAYVKMPVRGVLRRVSKESQSGKQRSERLAQLQFIAKPNVSNKRIVVVDDVTTTGATFRAVAIALAQSGCCEVLCIAPSWKPQLFTNR